MKSPFIISGLWIMLMLLGCQKPSGEHQDLLSGVKEAPNSVLPDRIDFNEHIRPILNKHCIECHGGVKAAGGVSFLFREEALVRGESGKWAIRPGSIEESHVLTRITDREDPMPPSEHGDRLAAEQVALIRKWIHQGAEWATHWAYLKPESPKIPSAESGEDLAAIDAFVRAKLAEKGLRPSPPQQREGLMRRLALDLTGLPPTEGDFQRFGKGPLEPFVDHLLASPHYGERWASMWMDLARYADTMGYEKDNHRNAWPYRDYLIRSFNQDKPYDRFIIEQIAGDLLPNLTMDSLVATAFHRNTQTNQEGGTDDEEFRVAAMLDRNATTWEVFQGTTMGCVQCHSHPYDPIRHEEYYQSYAYLNNTQDTDDGEFPYLRVPKNPVDQAQVISLLEAVPRLRKQAEEKIRRLACEDKWECPTPEVIDATGSGTLVLENDQKTLVTQGTISKAAKYQLRLPLAGQTLTALRIDALVDEGQEGIPNVGFSVAQVILELEKPGAENPEPIPLIAASADYTRADYWVEGVLNAGGDGWADYPRQYRDRWLVVIPKAPILIPQGGRLKVTIRHRGQQNTNEGILLRFRVSISSSAQWIQYGHDSERRQLLNEAWAKRKELSQIPGTWLPASFERPVNNQRDTRLFVRGNWMSPAQVVQAGVPRSLPPIQGQSRLDFARWLAAEKNPLTARVMANRLWYELFGRGIVSTLADFGTVGDRPSHPELLDYLATRFMGEYQWRLKPLLKEIVLSKTYQQSQKMDPEMRQRDPDNRWLARGPRKRLSAEMVRDQALQISGLLSRKQFGPSVMPPQPEGVWQTVYSGAQWVTSEGEDRYRRALYTYWRRTSPYPSLLSFDAPSREVCTTTRTETNTPLQALVKLNDPVYFECAKALAQRMNERNETITQQIRWAYRLATGSSPSMGTLDRLVMLYQDSLAQFEKETDTSQKIAQTKEQAALSIVASVILNLDSCLTK